MGGALDEQFKKAGLKSYLTCEFVMESAHSRGADELIHRALKDFASERMPFKVFRLNAVFYYTILTAFFLYECFKEDVCVPAVSLTAYPTTLRRILIDLAGKNVRTGGKIILKIAESVMRLLRFDKLWEKCCQVPSFA